MDDVTDLVLSPFREIVEKGNLALENAADAPLMTKAAQSLVKEGERALKKIEPICKKLLDDYGTNFVNALKDNDIISNYRSELADLLWDFDEYVEVDAFEADKYTELQSLSRKAAPKVADILMRMRLEPPAHKESIHFLSQLSPPSSPHPPSLSPLQPTPHHGFVHALPNRGSLSGSQAGSSQADAKSLTEYQTVEDATTQLQNFSLNQSMSNVPGHSIDAGIAVHGQEQGQQQQQQHEPPPPMHEPQPPRPPSIDPWDPQSAPYNGSDRPDSESPVERRETVYRPESPIDPAISPMSPEQRRREANKYYSGSITGNSDVDGSQDYDNHRQSVSSVQSNSHAAPAPSHGQRPRAPTLSPSIPEEEPPRTPSREPYKPPRLQVRPPIPQPYNYRGSAGDISPGAVGDMGRQYSLTTQAMQSHPPREPLPPPPPPPGRQNSGYGFERQRSSPSGTSTPRSQPGLEVAPMMPNGGVDAGLIPVDTESPSIERHLSMSPRDCNIGNGSSFYIHKGFCEGAKEVIRGSIGVKKIKKPGFASATTVARCTGCLFELDFSQIEIDVNKEDKGNFSKTGIDYRLRFLQKCHLPAKRVDDVLYGCPFCVEAGRTLDECDSTVFTTTKALFNHLARHPRPLPEIQGIAVVDQPNMPADLRNDYDVHFKNPPEAHPAQLNLSEIRGLPTGVAKEHSRRIYGQRLLFDRSPALELCQGARVTGITWPEKYNGDWIFAWHDGACASVPADIIKLEPPPQEEIRIVGSSLIRAKSRWKFAQKEKSKESDASTWLKFDKNEAITNISYPYPEHWCWSGTNAKGKWGIFPKEFLDPATVQQLTAGGSERAMTLTNEKNKSSSMLSKFSMRRPSGRPPSIAESTSSRETAGPYSGSRFSARGST